MGDLMEVNWVGLNYDIFDAIQSHLVENPNAYYMSPSRQWLCYLTREFGLLMLRNDFTMMSDEDISDYILGVLDLLYND